ncbi:hypothetical protein TWF696_009179 [Orbilia brochopaga]|uniref:Uncharacterized protein n=1 Tax=Orbilia brochopaga TaxID=3140254 RepID=A0AAV9UFG6_9PEZI
MPEDSTGAGTPPRSAKKRRRLEAGAGAGAGAGTSRSATRLSFGSSAANGARSPSPLIPPTPPFGSPPPRARPALPKPTARPNLNINTNNANADSNANGPAPTPARHSRGGAGTGNPRDPLAQQMLTLYTRLDDLRDDLAHSYEAERKARMDAHDAAQRQLMAMQGMLETIAREYARTRRRKRLERRLFGAGDRNTNSYSTGSHRTTQKAGTNTHMYDGDVGMNSGDYRDPNYNYTNGDVDMQDTTTNGAMDVDFDNLEDIDDRVDNGVDTRKYAYAYERRQTSETLTLDSSSLPQPAQHDDDDDDDEEFDEEDEDDDEDDSFIPQPRARNRLRRRVQPTYSPSLHGENENVIVIPSDSEPSSSLRALTRSLHLSTRRKPKHAPRRQPLSPPVSSFRSAQRSRRVVPDSQSQEAAVAAATAEAESGSTFNLSLSQLSIPPNPEDDDDTTYRASGSTTTSASDADAEATEVDADPEPETDVDIQGLDLDLPPPTTTTKPAAAFPRPRSPPPLSSEQITPANRPRRRAAHVANYYEWERYIIPAAAPPSVDRTIAKPRHTTGSNSSAGVRASLSPRVRKRSVGGGVMTSPIADTSNPRRHMHMKRLSLG